MDEFKDTMRHKGGLMPKMEIKTIKAIEKGTGIKAEVIYRGKTWYSYATEAFSTMTEKDVWS